MVPPKTLDERSPPPLCFSCNKLVSVSLCSEKAATVTKMQSNVGCGKPAVANAVTKTFRALIPHCPPIAFVSGTGVNEPY